MEIHHTPSEADWHAFLLQQCARTPVAGTVTAVLPFGCFVRLADGVDAIGHVSLWPDQPRVGDTVPVRVVRLDLAHRRVGVVPA